MTTTIFVSGATGYIAKHLIQQAIAKGYKVIGSVRSEAKGEALKKQFNSDLLDYVIVPDLIAKGAFDKALEEHPEIEVFYHTASPFHFGEEDVENNLLRPAVEGTKNALSAVKAHGKNVHKFVLTSSFAAIGYTPGADPTVPVSEKDFSGLTWEQSLQSGRNAYLGSKTFGEKAAWEFVKQEKPAFDFAVVNPVYVFGPQAFNEDINQPLNTAASIVDAVYSTKPGQPLPQAAAHYIDVRDVARGHLFAGENKSANNQRLLLSSEPFTSQTIANSIHKQFPELADKVAKGDPSATEAGLKSIPHRINNDKTRSILDFKFRLLDETIKDSIDQALKYKK